LNYNELSGESALILNKIKADPMSSFFKTPFQSIALFSDFQLVDEVAITPGDFNPGSAFDAAFAVRNYVKNNKVSFPRLYLYPTSVCNCQCPICQFSGRHLKKNHLSEQSLNETFTVFQKFKGDTSEQSLIVSGDGEPMVYPHLQQLLNRAMSQNLRIFLTSNFTQGYNQNLELYELMAQSLSMLTVSIKGLSPEAYSKYQGVNNPDLFHNVMKNLQKIVELREKYKNKRLIIGVASLILPENTGYYGQFADLLDNMGIDYFYLNQVEPTAEKWGIHFSEEQKINTLHWILSNSNTTRRSLIVRCSNNPFERKSGETVYYNAKAEKQNKDICGSALFNPLVLSDLNGSAQWIACRNSDLFEKDEYRFIVEDQNILPGSIQSVMHATGNCTSCRLERQVKHFDKLLTIERENNSKGDYLLLFDLDELAGKYPKFISFESIIK
jgi:wyosine [tRNA(Phe)-imidazoG37] synthetase (radical SAM superfamily)